MIESLILIEEQNVNTETLRSLSLANAKQLVIGSKPGMGVILHVAANSLADLGKAILKFAEAPGVRGVITLMIRTSQ
jgi:hypothetical protein